MEKRYETRSGDLFVRSWARVRRVSLDRRSSAGETDGVCFLILLLLLLQPHQGNMCRSWLRDTDSQNGDALLCIYYINFMYSE